MLRATKVFLLFLLVGSGRPAHVSDVTGLIRAVNNGSASDTVVIESGVYALPGPLQPKEGMTIRGAGAGETVLCTADSWDPGVDGLPDRATDHTSANREAYLFDLGSGTNEVTISDMTLTGPQLHGAAYGNDCDYLTLRNLVVRDFLWSGIRTWRMDRASIHDVEFINAGGKFGVTGGGIYATWMKFSAIYDNTFIRLDGAPNFYGIKGRQFKHTRLHHNTIRVGFSIELPHENDHTVEIDHNYLDGAVSIPKGHGGGSVPQSGYTFNIHHNYFTRSYSLEWPRNAVEVHHNLFDFDPEQDGGNLISNFSRHAAPGPTSFHNNLVRNPGRGILWNRGPYNRFSFRHNHVQTGTTSTPRTEGLFGLPQETDFSTIEISDNIIECIGLPRPLLRKHGHSEAMIRNNTLVNVSDADAYENPATEEPRGLQKPLSFSCGAHDQYLVDGWDLHDRNARRSSGRRRVSAFSASGTREEKAEQR